jgi:hypothetical protein
MVSIYSNRVFLENAAHGTYNMHGIYEKCEEFIKSEDWTSVGRSKRR